MKYTYPKISNALSYKRIDADTVEITDHMTENSFTFGIEAARYVRQLDGYTNPYRIPSVFSREEVDDMLRFLDEYELTRREDTIDVSIGTKLKTVWSIKHSASLKLFARLSNALLLISWLPILIVGILMFVNRFDDIEIDGIWIGYFVGLLCGMLFHELGHAFAGIAYGARVFEMGVMVTYCILPGAYVLLDKAPVKKRLQRIQINAAGVETNMLLGGLFLLLGAALPSLGGMFFGAAFCNLFLGVLNLTVIKGLDGTAIMSELLGVDDIIDRAKRIVFNRKARKRALRQGSCGYAAVTVCYMLLIMQIALPVLMVTNILEVIILCFV